MSEIDNTIDGTPTLSIDLFLIKAQLYIYIFNLVMDLKKVLFS